MKNDARGRLSVDDERKTHRPGAVVHHSGKDETKGRVVPVHSHSDAEYRIRREGRQAPLSTMKDAEELKEPHRFTRVELYRRCNHVVVGMPRPPVELEPEEAGTRENHAALWVVSVRNSAAKCISVIGE
ncbi:hypothetical protein HVZ60_04185 [Escherichia coli]|nr:hypothetical protein [Escherichia coli]